MLKAQAKLDQVTAAELDSPLLTQDSESQQLPALRLPWWLDWALTWLQTEKLQPPHLCDMALGLLQCLKMPAGWHRPCLGIVKLV